MDIKLLLDLFHIPALSSKENKIRDFITSYLKSIDIDFSIDDVGNIYNISNKNKPLLSAHMDTVQDDFDALMSKFIGLKNNIIKGYGIIGADDKCGIYAILDLLKNGHTDMNFLFSVEEEVGGNGSLHFTSKHDLSHILYGLILDRRGNGDIICEYNEYGTKEFEKTLSQIGTHFGFKPDKGTFSDADNISEQISCANLSVGYYNAHFKNEYAIPTELQNTINYVHSIIKNLDVKFKAPDKTLSYSGSRNFGWLNGFDDDFPKDNDFSEYLYSEEQDCDLCGTTKIPVKYIKTLQSYLCVDCITDLKFEIEDIDCSVHDRFWGAM